MYKTLKKRILSILLVIATALSLLAVTPLTAGAADGFTTQPQSTFAPEGTDVSFSISYNAGWPLETIESYRWWVVYPGADDWVLLDKKGSTPYNNGKITYSGADSKTLKLHSVTADMDYAEFCCEVTGYWTGWILFVPVKKYSHVHSDIATLNVVDTPKITSPPSNRVILAGESTTFSVGATGRHISYQWQSLQTDGQWRDLINMPGARTSTFTIPTDYSESWAGLKYTFRCALSNPVGPPVYTDMVTLTVNRPSYTITYQANGGTGTMAADAVSPASVNKAANYTIKANAFTCTGYTLSGWLANDGKVGTYYAPGAVISNVQSNYTLAAQWAPLGTYTISYSPGGGTGTMVSDTVFAGESYKIKANAFTRAGGWTFAGWHVGGDMNRITYTAGATIPAVGKNTTLDAVWTGIKPDITSANAASIVQGAGGTFQVTATGSTPIAYYPGLGDNPYSEYATINITTGLMTFRDDLDPGTYNIDIQTSNGPGSYDTQKFTLTVTPAPKSVSVGSPLGTLMAESGGNTVYPVTTENIKDGEAGTVSWFSSAAGTASASAPVGVTPSVSKVSNNAATVSMDTDDSTVVGTHYFKVTIAGQTSNVAMLTVAPAFVAVTDITGVPAGAVAGTPLTLAAVVAPANATNKAVTWRVKSAGTTGAAVAGNTFTATAAGTAIVTATVKEGESIVKDFEKDFTITVSADGDEESVAPGGFPFTDVKPGDWFYNDVKTAYEMGLINGKTPTLFAPGDNLTYAEAVKLAACMHQKYTTGSVTLANATPTWYQSYVDYAKANGIISKDYNWSAQATRAGYMEMFANALPDSALAPFNTVPDGSIPDVPMAHPQAAAIYKLYRAGILQGVDTVTHSCNPGSNIRRSEVAAILTRMMNPSERVSFSM